MFYNMIRIKELYEQYILTEKKTFIGKVVGENEIHSTDNSEADVKPLRDLESVKNYYLNAFLHLRRGDLTKEEEEKTRNLLGPLIKKFYSQYARKVKSEILFHYLSVGDLSKFSREEIEKMVKKSDWINHALLPRTEEEWEAFENDELYTYEVYPEFIPGEDTNHFIDYYLYLKNNPNNINNTRLQKLFRINSYTGLGNALGEFDRVLAIEDKKSDGKAKHKGETIMNFGNGYTIQELDGDECKNEEGPLMKHCVRNYNYTKSNLYSLRDSENRPHVTIEVDNNIVRQIKGKANGPVSNQYVPYIEKFLDRMRFKYNEEFWINNQWL